MTDSLNNMMAQLVASGCYVVPPDGDGDFTFTWISNGVPVRFTHSASNGSAPAFKAAIEFWNARAR